MLLAVPASASDLTDAVDAYNTAAAGLQDLYDDFIADQNAAYATFQDMYDALGLHILADDLEEAGDYWDDHVAARTQLAMDAAVLDDSFFGDFLPALNQAVQMLQGIIDLDAQSPNEVAYVSDSPHFSLPATPFLFWKDEGEPSFEEFMEFEFPQLAVGDVSHTSYSSGTLTNFGAFVLQVYELIRAAIVVIKHRDTGQNLNDDRADDWDALCNWCLCILDPEPPPLPDGWTKSEAEDFCKEYSYGWGAEFGYCEEGVDDGDKPGLIRTLFRSKQWEDIEEGPVQAIEDYLMIAWYWDFPWEVE
ncbi:MAG TPA: hypothetical protein ENL23_00575 [Candidatus Acetothermia bacterium]|nr:hypothetical protein [Candidatus Acetothermia bacterium]